MGNAPGGRSTVLALHAGPRPLQTRNLWIHSTGHFMKLSRHQQLSTNRQYDDMPTRSKSIGALLAIGAQRTNRQFDEPAHIKFWMKTFSSFSERYYSRLCCAFFANLPLPPNR